MSKSLYTIAYNGGLVGELVVSSGLVAVSFAGVFATEEEARVRAAQLTAQFKRPVYVMKALALIKEAQSPVTTIELK